MGNVRKLIRRICGWVLVVGGVIGLFLPILQGTVMIIAGAALLGWDVRFLKRLWEKAASRLPWRGDRARRGKG